MASGSQQLSSEDVDDDNIQDEMTGNEILIVQLVMKY